MYGTQLVINKMPVCYIFLLVISFSCFIRFSVETTKQSDSLGINLIY